MRERGIAWDMRFVRGLQDDIGCDVKTRGRLPKSRHVAEEGTHTGLCDARGVLTPE